MVTWKEQWWKYSHLTNWQMLKIRTLMLESFTSVPVSQAPSSSLRQSWKCTCQTCNCQEPNWLLVSDAMLWNPSLLLPQDQSSQVWLTIEHDRPWQAPSWEMQICSDSWLWIQDSMMPLQNFPLNYTAVQDASTQPAFTPSLWDETCIMVWWLSQPSPAPFSFFLNAFTLINLLHMQSYLDISSEDPDQLEDRIQAHLQLHPSLLSLN